MRNALDILISVTLFIVTLLIWIYKMILSSDIPVKISLKELISFISAILIYMLIQYLYINRTKFNLLNLSLLVLPTILWFISLQNALTYHYHKYDTISDSIGFISTLIILGYCSYKTLIKHKKVKLD